MRYPVAREVIRVNPDGDMPRGADAFGIDAGAHLVPVKKRTSVKERRALASPQAAADYLKGLAESPVERFIVVPVDQKNRPLGAVIASQGALNEAVVGMREVFAPAVEARAAAIIVAHNHPSGDSTPSAEDVRLTGRLVDAGHLLGIPVLDHLVIGDRVTSLRSIASTLFNARTEARVAERRGRYTVRKNPRKSDPRDERTAKWIRSETNRAAILQWLQSVDPNGVWPDEMFRREYGDRATTLDLRGARAAALKMLRSGGYACSCSRCAAKRKNPAPVRLRKIGPEALFEDDHGGSRVRGKRGYHALVRGDKRGPYFRRGMAGMHFGANLYGRSFARLNPKRRLARKWAKKVAFARKEKHRISQLTLKILRGRRLPVMPSDVFTAAELQRVMSLPANKYRHVSDVLEARYGKDRLRPERWVRWEGGKAPVEYEVPNPRRSVRRRNPWPAFLNGVAGGAGFFAANTALGALRTNGKKRRRRSR